ncbi:MAG: GNAT family N-acetyltransferase, partial [Veillonella sp.]|nr:GNAT family N-acetyltransferase [Veillonella sp.]
VAGVIVVRKEEGRKAEIMNLAVADIFRRRGLARKLLRHVPPVYVHFHSVHPYQS